MTTEEKIRWLAEQAGWGPSEPHDGAFVWSRKVGDEYWYRYALPDYPHSFDAIARDLLPLLWERGWRLDLWLDSELCQANVYDEGGWGKARGDSTTPAAAAFEAIFEALHGATE